MLYWIMGVCILFPEKTIGGNGTTRISLQSLFWCIATATITSLLDNCDSCRPRQEWENVRSHKLKNKYIFKCVLQFRNMVYLHGVFRGIHSIIVQDVSNYEDNTSTSSTWIENPSPTCIMAILSLSVLIDLFTGHMECYRSIQICHN
mmetsp:Transcript_53564/g.59828  ORF Transcript_53564/g.59828 Transcript_53564/m.59828 type:complete len:147 (+) Transcript_53564:176-616(+)